MQKKCWAGAQTLVRCRGADGCWVLDAGYLHSSLGKRGSWWILGLIRIHEDPRGPKEIKENGENRTLKSYILGTPSTSAPIQYLSTWPSLQHLVSIFSAPGARVLDSCWGAGQALRCRQVLRCRPDAEVPVRCWGARVSKSALSRLPMRLQWILLDYNRWW
jgi:hypothetical protein